MCFTFTSLDARTKVVQVLANKDAGHAELTVGRVWATTQSNNNSFGIYLLPSAVNHKMGGPDGELVPQSFPSGSTHPVAQIHGSCACWVGGA